MVKKLTLCLLLMMLMLTVALADTQVQDDAGLFTADEIAEISAICDRIESAYQVDMFVLTSQDVPSGQTTAHVTDAILRALQKIPGKAVVFCRLRARTESLAERLNRAGIPAAAYHAGLNREERSRVVQAYLSGRIRVVTATSAFGMGVDIPDIRLILHDHLPTNMIDYVQQSGRAGRDGETAYALLLFSPADFLRFHTRCQQIRVQHKHRPFTQYALIQREWRPYRRVLRFCLQAPCLSQGISAAFGQKSAPCGNCSACRSGAIGKEIPNIPRMTVQELYCWILQLHRDELHRRNPHQKQATNAQLREIAETMQLPDNLPGRETYFPYLRAFHTISR